MFELVIKKPDGSAYTTEYFGSLENVKKWLETEKTRPYWDSNFTYQITDHTPPPMPKEEKEKLEKEAAAKEAECYKLKESIGELIDKDLSADQVAVLSKNLIKFLKLRGLLE